MKSRIQNVFADREEIPLYYIESGSRLWGMASPDSDYDIRGIHLLSKRQYFDFQKQNDIIDITKGDFDFVSFELDKAFGLLAKSNPNMLEWIRADTVYLNHLPDWEKARSRILDNIEYKALFHAYLSMAKNNIELLKKGKKFTYKTVLYSIRGLLSAELASKHQLPELSYDKLLDQFSPMNSLISIAKQSLSKKQSKEENEKMPPDRRSKILEKLNHYKKHLEDIDMPTSNNKLRLKRTLKEFSYNIKCEWYVN